MSFGEQVICQRWHTKNMPLFYAQQTLRKKDPPFDIAEYLFEIGKYFKERSRNTEIVISGILPRDECWSVNRIIISKINDILADKCSLHGFCFIYQKFGWARENGMLNPN